MRAEGRFVFGEKSCPSVERSLWSYRFARRASRRAGRPLRAPAEAVSISNAFELIEHGERLDFASLIEPIVEGHDRRWLPGDPTARYLPSGALVAAESTLAALTIPPMQLQRGLASAATDEMLARRTELRTLVRRFNAAQTRSIELHGYVTRMSAFVPGERAPQVAVRFARTAAPAAMLLLDLASSPGALLRARGANVELSGEYVAGRDDLRVALTFFLAAMLAVERGVPLPELDGSPTEAAHDGGWLVDRLAFGDDVYVAGRMASLRLAGGGTILAGTLLGEIWAAARPLVEAHATEEELSLVDMTVSGVRSLPLEREPEVEPSGAELSRVQPFAKIVRERRRGQILARPAAVTWDAATIAFTTPTRTIYARVPAEGFDSFASAFERGTLDKPIRAFAAQPSKDRVATLAARESGLFDLAEIPHDDRAETVRVGTEAPAAQPRQRAVSAVIAIRIARRVAALSGAAAMFVGTAAFAYIGLRQSEPQPKPSPGAISRKADTGVLGTRFTKEPAPQSSIALPQPTSTQSIAAAQSPFTNDPSIRPPSIPSTNTRPTTSRETSTPTPRETSTPTPRQTSTPQPTQTSTPRPTATATPTPTQTQPPPPPPPAGQPQISGSTSCGVSTSYLSFSLATEQGAPKITNIVLTYNGQAVQAAPGPGYPMASYSGSGTSTITPTSNHTWYIKVQDQSGRQVSKTFKDACK